MIKHFEHLTKEETELLMKAPVLVSVLAASYHHEISKEARADAIRLAHLKTFTAVPLLRPYYTEVEKNFKSNFEAIVKAFAPFNDENRELLLRELDDITLVMFKLDKQFAATLQWSLSKYAAHVKKAERVLLENFIFPFKIPGLTD